jgi:hypothetical protein
MYGSRLATTVPRSLPPAPTDNTTGTTRHATRSHPHPSPSQTGSRAASSPPRAGRNFFDSRKNAKKLLFQRGLPNRPMTVGDASKRNDSATRRVKSGKIRGICSVDVLVCHASHDRHEPEMMRCIPCRLFWEITDPEPPPCPAIANGEPTGREGTSSMNSTKNEKAPKHR